MGLLTFVGRIILVVLNIAFMLLSLALVIGGFILRFGHEVIRPHLKDVLDNIDKKVESVFGDTDFNTDNFELGTIVSDIAIVMITVGLFLLAMSFVGCCGSCYAFQTLMLVYALVLIALLLVQVVFVVLVFGYPKPLIENMKPKMLESLAEFQGLNGTTVESLGWNWMMQEFDCCGVDDYQDFHERSDKWWGQNKVTTPTACCKTLPDDSAGRNLCAGAEGSPTNVNAIQALSNYATGCAEAIFDKILDINRTYFIIGVTLCFGAQLVLIVFAVLVYKDRGIKGGLI